MLTDEYNEQQYAADKPDYQTNLSHRDTSMRLQYMLQHMQTFASKLNMMAFLIIVV